MTKIGKMTVHYNQITVKGKSNNQTFLAITTL